MERMGHSTITVTLDNYGHLFPKLTRPSTRRWTVFIASPRWARPVRLMADELISCTGESTSKTPRGC